MGFTIVPPAGASMAADATGAPSMPSGAFTIVPPAVDDPTNGMSVPSLIGAGFDSTFPAAWLGLKETALKAAGLLPGVDTSQSVAALEKEAAAQRAQDAPLLNNVWGSLGRFGGTLAAGAPLMLGAPETFIARLLASIGGGAAQGAVEPTTAGESTLGNIARGAGLGAVSQGALEGAAIPFRAVGGVTPGSADAQAAQAVANQYGGVLTRGQIGGNAWTQRIERMLASLPGSAPYYAKAAQANVGAATRAVNDITGGDAGKLIQLAPQGATFTADQAAQDAATALPRQFSTLPAAEQPSGALASARSLFGPAPQVPNPDLANLPGPLARKMIEQGHAPATVPAGASPTLAPGSTIPMTGPYGDFNNYQALRSTYGQLAQHASSNQDAAAYWGIQGILDDNAARSLEAAGVNPQDLVGARQAYAVQKIVQPARVVDANGNLTYDPVKLANVVAQVDRTSPGKIDGLGDAGTALRQVAAFGRTSRVAASSGTAEGISANKIATGALLADILRDPGEAFGNGIATLGALYGAPRIVNFAMQGTRNGIPLARIAAGALTGPTASYLARTVPLASIESSP